MKPRWYMGWLVACLAWAAPAASSAPLSLEQVLSEAARHNPTLEVAYAQMRQAEADVIQAEQLENPQLEARWLWPSGAGGGTREVSLSFNLIDLFNRGGRVRSAEQRQQAAWKRTLERALELEAELKASYYTVQGHLQALDEQKVLLQLAELQAELAGRQRRAGNIPALWLAQSQAELIRSRTQLYERQLALFRARQELARLMGQPERGETLEVEAQLAELPAGDQRTAPELAAEALAGRPDLKALQFEVQALRSDRDQQDWLVFDGTRLSYHLESEPQRNWQGVGLSMPLPLLNQRQGEKARLEAQVDEQQARQKQLSQQVQTEVKTHLVQMATARLRVEQLQQMVPLRQEMLQLARQQYNAMLKGNFELLGFRGEASNALMTLADAKADYWRARTELERTLGRSILADSLKPQELKEQETRP